MYWDIRTFIAFLSLCSQLCSLVACMMRLAGEQLLFIMITNRSISISCCLPTLQCNLILCARPYPTSSGNYENHPLPGVTNNVALPVTRWSRSGQYSRNYKLPQRLRVEPPLAYGSYIRFTCHPPESILVTGY